MIKMIKERIDQIQNLHKQNQGLHPNCPQKDENLEARDVEVPQDVEVLQDVKELHLSGEALVVEEVRLVVEEVHHDVEGVYHDVEGVHLDVEEVHQGEKIDLVIEVIVQKEIGDVRLQEEELKEEIAHHKEGLAILLQVPEVGLIIQLEMPMMIWKATQDYLLDVYQETLQKR